MCLLMPRCSKQFCSILKLQMKSISRYACHLTFCSGTFDGNAASNNWQQILPAPNCSILVTCSCSVEFIHSNSSVRVVKQPLFSISVIEPIIVINHNELANTLLLTIKEKTSSADEEGDQSLPVKYVNLVFLIGILWQRCLIYWHCPTFLMIQITFKSQLGTMRRLALCFAFSKFYHPCKFTLPSQVIETATCSLGNYIKLFRAYGHYYAKLDPLGLYNKTYEQFVRPTDLEIKFQDALHMYKFNSPVTEASQNIEQLEELLKDLYLGTTGVEFQHVSSLEERAWLYDNYERIKLEPLSPELKVRLAKGLTEAEAVDHFLHKKWNTFKRYSGEGAESTVVALEHLFELSSSVGYEHVVFGMPHRGRMNTLINVLDYGARHIFKKISGKSDTPHELVNVIDDVTSHVAQSTIKDYNGKKLKVTLVHNPSHLQAQNPVSMGKAHSKQQLHGAEKVLNVQVHGDAAICAQGIVFETLCLAKTPNFTVGGSVHIITNNQIGYTTRPIDSRPSKYATDLFKAYEAPIIHVNSENIEDVYRAVKLAVEYQRKFKKDVMIDLICYRKYGHNQVDEPEFTQPKMYHKIRKAHEPSPVKYVKKLIEQGLVPNDYYETLRKDKFELFEKQYNEAHTMPKITLQHYTNPKSVSSARAFTEQWKDFKPSQHGEEYPTAVDINALKEFALASTFIPPDFAVHSRIKRLHIEKRLKSIEENELDWATCEALALFSLVYEGHNIRMTGQDVERGTFSQRHLNLIDQKTEQPFNPLNFFAQQHPGRGQVEILNSALSQNAAMSFEYGYSIDDPNNLAIWQAQFGDFFNTAQVVVDVFLTNSENKWMRQSSLTLILPHGFDGAGPEHSSCRIERFLQMANSDGSLKYLQRKEHDANRSHLAIDQQVFYQNIQQANFSLVNPTKPANLFHLLRRQMKRNFRKPLIIAGPKTLLRHATCVSKFEDMGPNTAFRPILPYQNIHQLHQCDTVILTSGKFVYDIEQILIEKKSEKTVLLAIEELFPFPEKQLSEMLSKAPKSVQCYWVQEENFNGGAFQFVQNRINRVLSGNGISKQVRYVGRRAVAATAVGSSELHKREGAELANWIKSIIV